MKPLLGRVPVKMPVARKRQAAPKETIPAYWNPNRVGVRTAPASFMEKIEELGWGEIAITWNPVRERWQVFSKAPQVQHPICNGWRLLFIHAGPEGEYLPLDERVMARLYHSSSMAHGNGVKYFDRLVAEMQRDKEKKDEQHRQDVIDSAMESGWDYSRIKNIGKGSKFTDFHA